MVAADKLATMPDDPEANLTIGRYKAHTVGDWRGALPLLAKGSDEVLKGLAERSFAPVADLSAHVGLGDAWYDAAQSAKAAQKSELLTGANHWYTLAAPGLSGLPKARVDKRLAETATAMPARKIPATNLPSPGVSNNAASEAPAGATIDVLSMIDPILHARDGSWSREGAAVVSAGGARVNLEFPLRPTPTYRIEAIVEQHDGLEFLAFGILVVDHDVVVYLDRRAGKALGSAFVNGKVAHENEIKLDRLVFTPNKPARIVIAVSPTSVRVDCDGAKVIDWSGDAATLSAGGKGGIRPQTLWIGGLGQSFRLTKLTFQRVQ